MAIEGLGNLKVEGLKTGETKAKRNELLNSGVDQDTFAKALDGMLANTEGVEQKPEPLSIKFSNHAIERMSSRGISFTPETLSKIDNAVKLAGEKGAKETLVVSDDSAMIVNIANKTVVTVMDKAALKENIFTNIDAAVIV